jgi:branched-chain amino acid transport system ATP-binding protein
VTGALLRTEGLGMRFGGFVALDSIDLEVRAGERLGLIGPNGSGKSTFVNCLAGDMPHHDGRVEFAGTVMGRMKPHRRTRLGLARTFQLPRPFASMTVQDNIAARVGDCLEMVEMGDRAHALPRALTQVDLRKLELARAIAAAPRLLIADEAMAGLSHGEVDQILAVLFRLNAAGTAIIMIEHIMRAVTAFSERLVVFVAGAKIADGEPREVLASEAVERAYLGHA